MLTILVPTHNRLELLLNAIESIYKIFGNIQIIIADNSSMHYHSLPKFKSNVNVINVRQHEGDLAIVFKALIDNAKTKYSLIVQDDDVLVNKQLHQKIYHTLKYNNGVMSFAAKASKTNEMFLKLAFCGKFYDIPSFWHGNFQFGMCYYPTQALKYAVHRWFDDSHQYRIFEQSYDEAIALLAIAKAQRYTHCSDIGMDIGINNDNMSWNNILYRIYSSVTYIDDLASMLVLSSSWKENYKNIQFLDIIDDYPNISKRDIFNNKFILDIRNDVISKLNQHEPILKIQKYILYKMKQQFCI